MPAVVGCVGLRRAACLAVALLVAGCAGFEKATAPETSLVPASAPRVVGADTPARREHMRILAAYGGAYSDAALDVLLANVSARVSKASEQPGQAYRITVLNSPSINAFANTMIQAEKYGTPLARAFKVLSQEQRNERMMRAEEKAGRLPATMTVPMMLFILPALFIVLVGPAILDIMDNFIGMGR